MRSPTRAILTTMLCGLLATCGSRPGASAQKRVRPVYEKGTGRLQRLDFDSDGNGKIDSRTYMDGIRPLRSEVDSNEDGVVDRWEYYGPDGRVEKIGTSSENDGTEDTWSMPNTQGQIVRIEQSTERDGVIDRWQYFENGALVRVEGDTNGDGRIDRWEHYENGSIRVLALDTTRARGRPDRRLVYNERGELDRIETDPEATGTFKPLAAPFSLR